MAGATAGPKDPIARIAHLATIDGAIRTVEDFGAKGDFDPGTGEGSDDTYAIQNAIDWAYQGGRGTARAIVLQSANYMCGPITTYPYTTVIGTGRHTSNLFAKPGTRGHWWSDRGNGAQKLMLSGIAWYGRDEPGISSIGRFGRDGIPFGTEGILQGLWMRDAPNGTALDVSGNVGILRDLTLQGCTTGLDHYGNANQVENVIVMEVANGARLRGCFVRGLHVEAIDDGGTPLFMEGDCRISDVCFSLAERTAFDHLIEIDISRYDEWSISNLQVFARNAKLNRSFLKVGSEEQGGTALERPRGFDILPGLDLHAGHLSLGGQVWRSATLIVEGGPNGPRVRVATPEPESGSFGSNISIEGPRLLFREDRVARGNSSLTAQIARNTTGTALTADITIGPDPDRSLTITLYDAVNGAPFSLDRIPTGRFVKLSLMGFGG